MEVAEVHDRMHLKTTHYAYAKHAEALGEYPTAITRLEREGDIFVKSLATLRFSLTFSKALSSSHTNRRALRRCYSFKIVHLS